MRGVDLNPDELVELMSAQRGRPLEPPYVWMAQMDPEFTAAFNRMATQVFGLHADGSPDNAVLTPKIKEFIAIAVLAAEKNFDQMPHHLGRLIEWYGATEREILEVLQIVGVMKGGPCMRSGIATYLRVRDTPDAARLP